MNSAYVSVTGTKEYVTCSNHGICDTDKVYNSNSYKVGLGICHCYDGWRSSDGKGNAGDRNDCGYNYAGGAVAFNTTFNTVCAVSGDNKICSGHGTCTDHTTGSCSCDSGYSKWKCLLIV